LLLHRATLGPDGEPLVDGRPWNDPAVAAAVTNAVGAPARLVRGDGLDRFDVLPLLVATDGSIAALGYDLRRLRPNIVIGGVEGLAEREWEGRILAMGDALIGAVDLRERCIMTTFDPDTAAQNVDVLLRIRDRFEGRMALNCEVVQPGHIRVGDRVQLVAR
jgi:uncharacterized protein YcbX